MRNTLNLLLVVLLLLTLCGCSPFSQEKRQRFFWPPPPNEPKIEYINFYYSDEHLQRGVDRRLEAAILGKRNPERLIYQPYSVASDGNGRFFVVDFGGDVVHTFDIRNHKYRQLAVGIEGAQKVVVDRNGEIWFLSSTKGILHHYAADEKKIGEVKLSGTNRATAFAVDRERNCLYVVDVGLHQVHVYDLNGRFLQSIGKRGNQPGEFNYPGDIDLDVAGNLYIVDAMNARIQILAPDGTPIRTFGERGTARAAFAIPKGIAVSPSGLVYVSDASQHKIVIFSNTGEYLLTLGARYISSSGAISPGGFYFPAGIDIDVNETIWIADLLNGIVHEFQYLTPEFLAKRPIREEDIHKPTAADFRQN